MKKVLIISYYWPPAGGPGVQRWLKFVKYLPSFGVQPVVYVPENAHYPILDHDLAKDIDKNITVIKGRISEPYKWAMRFSKNTKNISSGIIKTGKNRSWKDKLMLFIRGNFFIPDARVNWVKPSVALLLKYLEENKDIDTVITTGPPHSVHLIGHRLKKKANIRWIADFRDPWTTISYHKDLGLTKWAANRHKILEKMVLNTADHIITTSFSTKKEFEAITQQPITVITNGYDVEYVEKRPIDTRFSVSHIGSLLSERNPIVFWQALSELVQEHIDFSKDLQLNFVGRTSDEVLKTIQQYGLQDYVKRIDYVSHNEALVLQRTSQVLLLIERNAPDAQGIIAGKIFEYMAAERPVLAIVPPHTDVEKIIVETNIGVACHYEDKEKMKKTLLKYYEDYKNNDLNIKGIGLQYYSRKKLTEKLWSIILKL